MSGAPEAADLLVLGGWIETGRAEGAPIPGGGIAVRDGRILALGPAAAIRAAYAAPEVVDASRHLVIPGFVDAHLHSAYHNALRLTQKTDWTAPGPLALGGRFAEFMRGYARLDATAMTPEESRDGARAALLAALMAGTTCFNEGSVGSIDGIAEAALAVGLRGTLTHPGAADLGWTGTEAMPARIRDPDAVLRDAEAAVLRWRDAGDGRLRAWFTLATDVTSSDALIRGIVALARQHGTGWSSHVCTVEDQDRVSLAVHGRRGLARLDALGALGPELLAVHMGFMEPGEVARLAATGTRIAHCPGTSMGAGKGILARRILLGASDAGVLVALGSDTSAAGSQLQQAQLAFFGHKEAWQDDRRLDPRRTLAMATSDAARAIGRGEETGALEVGMAADLVTIRTDGLRYAPFDDPLLALWRVGHAGDVDTVMVGGRVLVRGGAPLHLDPREVRRAAEAAGAAFRRRVLG